MQTRFTEAQLRDPDIREANQILRTCVHCGFCTATCPTFVLLGDELDSPRGRIYLIKDMLENEKPASEQVVRHLDRCLSCLACMTTCPSGVHYQHLIDHARAYIEETYQRPWHDRALRALLAFLIPRPRAFRLALRGAVLGRPFKRLLRGRLRAMLELAPTSLPKPSPLERPQVVPAQGTRRMRVALLTGCAQQVLDPGINEATVRLLARHGVEVVIAQGMGCCGSMAHHIGKAAASHAQAARNVEAWWRETEAGGGEGLDAIVANASGCGTTLKDYGYMFREDAKLKEKAAAVAALAKDVTEILLQLGLMPPVSATGQQVAYHSACSMQHGQQLKTEPQTLLAQAGFTVRGVPEGHLCCGSAGVYNILQPEIANQLRERKLANIAKVQPELIATGNIGCMTQLATHAAVPVVHTVELLDWATGGPLPPALEGRIDANPVLEPAAS
ncbi:MAG: glycolate oxidase iron-sulfur subunit [Geminicoccaceae bacterium]|nr:MAG: glycolate oxidase iron-sulfur subunit [Geminicoccaceae bacterium]